MGSYKAFNAQFPNGKACASPEAARRWQKGWRVAWIEQNGVYIEGNRPKDRKVWDAGKP